MQRKALKLIYRILSAVLTAFLAVIVAANIYTAAARAITGEPQPTFFGYSSAVIVSGSMSGTIDVGDLIICRTQQSYTTGDIITFREAYDGDSLVTHRIVSQTDAGFITQGDANNTPDSQPVSAESIAGKVVCIIPKIGFFIEYLRTPLGMTCVVLIGLLLLALPSALESAIRQKEEDSPTTDEGKGENGADKKLSEK